MEVLCLLSQWPLPQLKEFGVAQLQETTLVLELVVDVPQEKLLSGTSAQILEEVISEYIFSVWSDPIFEGKNVQIWVHAFDGLRSYA